MQRVILHYDLDAFYASVEIRDNPKLKDVAFVVGETVVITASYEARKYGVHSAMSVLEAKKLCPHIKVVPARKEKYKEASEEIHRLMEKLTTKVEYIALDEGYLDISELILHYPSKEYFAKKLKQRIFEKTGLTCSVGIGYNKLSAKLASDRNKPNGFCIFENEREFQDYVLEKPLSIIPGVGKKWKEQLQKRGYVFVKDVLPLSYQQLEAWFGNARASLLYYGVRGIHEKEVDGNREYTSIGNEQSFRQALEEEEAKRELRDIFEHSYERLRRKKMLCRMLGLKIKYQNFHMLTRSKHFLLPMSEKELLWQEVEFLWEALEQKQNIRLLGLSFGKLVKQENYALQLSFSWK